MSNELFLEQYKNYYESLNFFSINNNTLMLKVNESAKTFVMPLINVSLANINPSLFLLKPEEIYHTIYILELLFKQTINSYEIEFITNFVNKYLLYNDKALALNNSETANPEIDNLNILLNGFKIPIYMSYDPIFENNPASQIIKDVINKHSEEIENSKGKHPRLVLINSNFQTEDNDDDAILSQAGFTSLILIFLTITATCLYIAHFIFGA